MTQQPANAFASHLINQTLSSVALLESLAILNSADAMLIRQKLPNPTGPFTSLSTSSPTSSFSRLDLSQQPHLSPTASWTVRHAQAQDEPSQSQSQSQPPPVLPPRGPHESVEQRAKAMWDFNGAAAEDLQFRAGDHVIIDEEVNDTWYRGRLIPQGHNLPLPRVGLFPANYVEKLPLPPTRYYSSPPPGPQAMVPYQQGPQYGYDQKQPMQGQMQMMPPQQQMQGSVVQQDPQNKGKFGKIGSQLGNAAVTGAGFGFGSAVASEIVHAIF